MFCANFRDRREQEVRELEKHQKEKQERERAERERQDREKLEKQRAAEQAVHKHFEESLRLAQQKVPFTICPIYISQYNRPYLDANTIVLF